MSAPAAEALQPVATTAEAQQLVVHLTEAMDGLQQVMQEETDLIRAGRIEAATRLEKSKSELARVYAADASRFRMSHAFLMRTVPGSLAALRERHDNFRSLLELNLRVLATAHLVSEGIIRGVAGELSRKASPQTYGASGRAVAPPRTSQQPLALSRTL